VISIYVGSSNSDSAGTWTIDGTVERLSATAATFPIANVTVTLTTQFTTATYTAITDTSGNFQVMGLILGGFSGDTVFATAMVDGHTITTDLTITHLVSLPPGVT
jgi:hypothetical protein